MTDFFNSKDLKSLVYSIKLSIYRSHLKLEQESALVYFRGTQECVDENRLTIFKIYRNPKDLDILPARVLANSMEVLGVWVLGCWFAWIAAN